MGGMAHAPTARLPRSVMTVSGSVTAVAAQGEVEKRGAGMSIYTQAFRRLAEDSIWSRNAGGGGGGGGANPGNNLHVSGLSSRVDNRMLEESFGKYGKVSVNLSWYLNKL